MDEWEGQLRAQTGGVPYIEWGTESDVKVKEGANGGETREHVITTEIPALA